jgi:hypothetical protein
MSSFAVIRGMVLRSLPAGERLGNRLAPGMQMHVRLGFAKHCRN